MQFIKHPVSINLCRCVCSLDREHIIVIHSDTCCNGNRSTRFQVFEVVRQCDRLWSVCAYTYLNISDIQRFRQFLLMHTVPERRNDDNERDQSQSNLQSNKHFQISFYFKSLLVRSNRKSSRAFFAFVKNSLRIGIIVLFSITKERSSISIYIT